MTREDISNVLFAQYMIKLYSESIEEFNKKSLIVLKK